MKHLEGKRVLIDTPRGMDHIYRAIESWGLLIERNVDYPAWYSLLEKYQSAEANTAVYPVFQRGDQLDILELPKEIRRTFVVVKSRQADPKLYTDLDKEDIPFIYEGEANMVMWLKIALMLILSKKSK